MMAKLGIVMAVAIVCSSMSAHAFTYDNRTNQNPDGTARFTDPEGKAAKNGSSHFSMHFSGGSPGQTSQDSRFVPSANGVFSSPFDSPNNMDTALGNRHW